LSDSDIEQRAVNVIRGLAMDGPQAAHSGHSGTAMAMAPLATVLWTRIMKYDPADPHWPDRDRFVLSCGHASILLYSMLHLTGYDVSHDDLRQFRQWGSRTPGHPEVGHTAGVEVTTGPLGQGFSNGVGLALAERYQRERYGTDVVDHHTYAICGDGDLEEGISHEAASLAGHLGLGRMIYVYDDNHITIDGPTELALSDDPVKRFEAYGWHVQNLGEKANDLDALEAAVRTAQGVEEAPSLIVVRSHIGWPSPRYTDSAFAHGNPFGDDEISATKAILGIEDEPFWIPDDVVEFFRDAAHQAARPHAAWTDRFARMGSEKSEFEAALTSHGFDGWEAKLPRWDTGETVATRKASGQCFNAILDLIPGLIGGGADLTGNTGTALDNVSVQSLDDPGGRQIHFGIREHAMGAIMTGLAMHGGMLPVGGTFFVFSDYMRGAVRLAAISKAHVIYSWTHDSVGVGEDGPTHQPIEQLAAMRAMPDLRVVRPADANETAQAWRIAVGHDGPVALILSRQGLPVLDGTEGNEGVARGAYVLSPADGDPELVLIGTGSEVHVCIDAQAKLQDAGVATAVVSMPSWDLFAEQPDAYARSVLPPGVPTLSVEAGTTFGWERYADASVGIDRFGASAPGATVFDELGINPDHVVERANALLDPTT
jgi:transketolase